MLVRRWSRKRQKMKKEMFFGTCWSGDGQECEKEAFFRIFWSKKDMLVRRQPGDNQAGQKIAMLVR